MIGRILSGVVLATSLAVAQAAAAQEAGPDLKIRPAPPVGTFIDLCLGAMAPGKATEPPGNAWGHLLYRGEVYGGDFSTFQLDPYSAKISVFVRASPYECIVAGPYEDAQSVIHTADFVFGAPLKGTKPGNFDERLGPTKIELAGPFRSYRHALGRIDIITIGYTTPMSPFGQSIALRLTQDPSRGQ
jgi:hypothetical protein